ncbi:MAG: NTF2 fold immunity protein [Dysgonomonas sp.]|nr:NTF2 fold immunity protein [Dysgonomonas sp.]
MQEIKQHRIFDQLIDLSKSEFVDEPELKDYLISLPLVYGTLMNRIEDEIYQKTQQDRSVSYLPEFRQKYLPIFEAFASEKKRVYGGKANSYGFPSKYNGIENAVEKGVELKNKNRAEVYFRTENNFRAEYLFVLIRKNGAWRIDNAKRRWYGNTEWNSIIL